MSNNKNSIQIYYLCHNTDNKCKELIEMINVIVLNKLLKNQEYINENNDITESVINDKINELTSKLIVKPDTKREYIKYKNENIAKIVKSENDFINNMIMNNMGQQPPGDDGDEYDKELNEDDEKHNNEKHKENHNQQQHTKHTHRGGNILTKKSYKKYKKSHRIQKTKNHKKSKKIRKI